MIDQAVRRLAIGGSEVGAIFGVSSFQDAFGVWASKKGGLPPGKPTERMLVGKALEQGVLQLYTHITGREVQPYFDQTFQHPDRPWMVYTPDALVKGERRGVDCKVVAWDQRHRWGPTAEDIPLEVQLQCWWYMAALNYEAWDVAALVGDGLPHVYEIYRDLEAEEVMLARVYEFWARYIAGDEVPPITQGLSAGMWLQQAFPREKTNSRPAEPQEVDLLEQYAQVRVQEAQARAARGSLENQIKLAIADHEGLYWSHGKFTWKKTKDGTKVDWESAARGLLQRFITDKAERDTLMGIYTKPKPGYRRIYFRSDLMPDLEDNGE